MPVHLLIPSVSWYENRVAFGDLNLSIPQFNSIYSLLFPVYVHLCTGKYTCVSIGGQRLTSVYSSITIHIQWFWDRSFTECWAHWLSILADLKTSSILLPPALSWDYKRAKPCLAFYVGLEGLNWVLRLGTVFYPQNHLLSPRLQFSAPSFHIHVYLYVLHSRF